MYSILIGLKDKSLATKINIFMKEHNFTSLVDGLYVPDFKANPVDCVLVFQKLAKEMPNLKNSLLSARLLKIDTTDDLLQSL